MRSALVILSAAALAACSMDPAWRQPKLPIAATYADLQPGGTRRATDLGWRDYFGDARLKAYIAAALANNRDLAASTARIAVARAQYRIQNAQRLPAIGVSADGARQLSSGTTAASGGRALEFSQYDASVALSAFELDFWGRLRSLSEAARANYLSTVEAERAFRLSLIGDVASTYLSMRSGEEQIALAERTLATRKEYLAIAKLRFDAGVTSSVDYDQAVSLVTQAQTELADLRRTTAQTEDQLTVLVGGPIAAPLPQPRSIDDEGQFRPLDAGLPSALLTSRPDILEAEQTLRAANANVRAARAAFFPTISLTGNYGGASSALSNLFSAAARTWTYGGVVDLPILDWGRRSGALAQNRAQVDVAAANYQKVVQVAFREVSDALVARRRYAEQIDAQVQSVEALRRLAETAQLRYDNGISIYLEVLDAQRNLFTAEEQLIQLRSAALQNGVSLYIALGGGLGDAAGGRP